MQKIIAVFLLMLLLSSCGRSMPYTFPYNEDEDEPAPVEADDGIDWRYAYELVLGSVPGLADYCAYSDLEVMDPGDETISLNDFECYHLMFCVYDGDDLVVKRRFAVSKIFPVIYEQQMEKDYWFEREVPLLGLSLYDARQILKEKNVAAGFAYLGETDNWSQIARNTLSNIMYGFDNILSGYGSSEYLIVPTYPNSAITVNLYKSGSVKEMLYHSDNGEPVIVSADSETDNIEIVIQGDADTVVFSPEPIITEIVSDDGAVITSLIDILDIGLPFDNDRILEAALASDPPLKGMSMMVDEGNVINLQYHPCQVVWFGTDRNESFVREHMLAISDDYQWVFEYSAADDIWYQIVS